MNQGHLLPWLIVKYSIQGHLGFFRSGHALLHSGSGREEFHNMIHARGGSTGLEVLQCIALNQWTHQKTSQTSVSVSSIYTFSESKSWSHDHLEGNSLWKVNRFAGKPGLKVIFGCVHWKACCYHPNMLAWCLGFHLVPPRLLLLSPFDGGN